MSHRSLTLPALIVLLALPSCSGRQTARTHVQSDQPALALQIDEWQALDGAFEPVNIGNTFPTVYSSDVESATIHEGDLRVAQELLELLNSGRAAEAMAMIRELGLAERALAAGGDYSALLGQLQGTRGAMPREQDGALQQLIGNPALGGGLVLDGLGGESPMPDRSPSSSIDAAFSSHRAAFDKIGP